MAVAKCGGHVVLPADPSTQQVELKVPADIEHTLVSVTLCSADHPVLRPASRHLLPFWGTVCDDCQVGYVSACRCKQYRGRSKDPGTIYMAMGC